MIRRLFATVLLTVTAFFAGAAVNTQYPFNVAFTTQATLSPTIDDEVWCPSLEGIMEWHREVQRRFSDAVILHCHGGELNGEWYLLPEGINEQPIRMLDAIKKLRKKYGNRKIVIACCNPGHFRLDAADVGDVVYPTESIWQRPDKATSFRSVMDPATPGNIFEFQSTGR